MNLTPVQSSQVKALGYNPQTKTMTVQFHSGGIYHYHNVDAKHHHAILNTESVGSYLHKHIKNRHKFTQ